MIFKHIAIAATALTMMAGAASAQVSVQTDNGVGLFDAGGLYGPPLNNGTNAYQTGTEVGIDRTPTASIGGERIVGQPAAADNGVSVQRQNRGMFDEYGNIPRS